MKLLQVYGHPRSGNNFLATLLARNFYPDLDLKSGVGAIGHWANRSQGHRNLYGKLAGGHCFPCRGYEKGRAIYIIRDGRDVVLSLWRSKHFKHKDQENISLSEFLRQDIDWWETPGQRSGPRINAIQHWRKHILLWSAEGDVHFVHFEQLIANPIAEMEIIAERFDLEKPLAYETVNELVGWFPNQGQVGGWKKHFSGEDLAFFHSIAPKGFFGLWHPGLDEWEVLG